MTKRYAPATERNRQPVLSVLQTHLPSRGTVLEISSGTGQHAAYFASRFPDLWWQPTDIDETNLASIAAWRDEASAPNLLAPQRLDVMDATWWVERAPMPAPVTAVVNINMIHIAPWPCCEALFSGAARLLSAGDAVLLYGPFKQGGEHTAPSHAAFDAQLRSQDTRWGVRDIEAVIDMAEAQGVGYQKSVKMPANNLMVLFRRG